MILPTQRLRPIAKNTGFGGRLAVSWCMPGALILCIAGLAGSPALAGEAGARRPIAEVLGRTVYAEELTPPAAVSGPSLDGAALERARGEKLRGIVWTAVFEDYSRQRRIEPTAAEIESHLQHHRRFQQEDKIRREKERERLTKELRSSDLTEARRKQAQQHLETLDRLEEHEARITEERRDPAREKMWQESERRVTEFWVKRWKINQALYREFGGRIIFQQAGWEPIDAYRKLLEQYEAKKAFVVHDRTLRDAVYGYFKLNFVYADESKAKFYFEKPYWERSEAELKAAGFK